MPKSPVRPRQPDLNKLASGIPGAVHYIKTSIGLAEGLSVTTKIDSNERLLNNYKVVGHKLVFTGSHVMNFFTPELTLALPQYPNYELLFRFITVREFTVP